MIGTGEDAVTIQVTLGGYKLAALLETGARSRVIDRNTLLELHLQQEIVEEPGKVLGLCDTPISGVELFHFSENHAEASYEIFLFHLV